MAGLPGRAGDDRISGEQAALRRVATLVARGAPPDEVFAAIAEEAGRLLHTDYATMNRYDPHGTITIVASWSSTGAAYPAGTQWSIGGRNVNTLVFQSGRATRIDDYASASGPAAELSRERGLRAGVGVPVSVEGQPWGCMFVASTVGPLPVGTEARLAGFTELAATAIANAQARVDLRGFAEEQAALRRVATLVAHAAPPAEVLTAVTAEAGRLLHTDHATMARYDPGGAITVAATWSSSTGAVFPVGTRWSIGGQNLHTLVFQTRRPARIDDYSGASGRFAEAVRELGLRAGVGVPVSVEGRLWGVMAVTSQAGPLAARTEARL
ncbi:MAG TPA: GAF domain-containing protein, partial [Streptosporangiaceae bacterium]